MNNKEINEGYKNNPEVKRVLDSIVKCFSQIAIECTHCYGTGKDHGDESMQTDCPSCTTKTLD